MNNYTSRQVAPALYREDTGLACNQIKILEKGKTTGKKVYLIFNEDAFSGIDIHTNKDLYLVEQAMKFLIKNGLIELFTQENWYFNFRL